MVGHGGSSAGSYLTDPTSPIRSHCASIVATSNVRVKVRSLRLDIYIHIQMSITFHGIGNTCTISSLLGRHRQHGMRSLLDTFAHDRQWELNPRRFDRESSNALSTLPRAQVIQKQMWYDWYYVTLLWQEKDRVLWSICQLFPHQTCAWWGGLICQGKTNLHCAKKASVHQVTTMLATSKNVLFPGHNHLLKPPVLMTWHFDYCPSTSEGDNQSVRSSVPVVTRWLGPGNRTFLEVASMVVTWCILVFFVLCPYPLSDVCDCFAWWWWWWWWCR